MTSGWMAVRGALKIAVKLFQTIDVTHIFFHIKCTSKIAIFNEKYEAEELKMKSVDGLKFCYHKIAGKSETKEISASLIEQIKHYRYLQR